MSQHIDFINPTIAVEYERRLSALGDDDYEGPTTLGIRDVLKAHFLIADFFAVEGEGLGGVGPKSLDLLHSALFRQSAHVGQPFKTSSRFDVCATLFFGIVKNHCFHDANKRTALLCLLFHLEKIGYCPAIPQVQLEDFAVEVADNALGKYARYNEFQKSSEFDANVAFISDYFKRNCRKIDTGSHIITYRELSVILARHDFILENPYNNSIEIVKYEEKTSWNLFKFGKKERVRNRVGLTGFPGWSKQVAKSDIKKIRQMTGLRYADGVDSASFYGKLDSMKSLITTYQEPLRRLASR